MTGVAILTSHPSASAVSASLGNYILAAQSAGLARHNVFKVGVSGGSLPAVLAAALLPLDGIQWDKWVIFFADERAVPSTSPDSNYGLLKSELLDKIPDAAPKPTVVTIDEAALEAGEDTQELADRYEQELVRSFAAKDSVKTPIFDLLLLGAGPDGHTCSLFPGHELLREDTMWVAAIDDSPKPPPRRITLTLPVVTHANRIAFVAMGAGKKDVMKTIFEEPDKGLPCSLVNEGAGEKVTWFVDDAAVEGVAYPRRTALL